MRPSDWYCRSSSSPALDVAYRKTWHWAIGVSVALVLAASCALILWAVSPTIPAEEAKCRARALNDAHADIEAFFQNPSGQDAWQQAIAACRK